MAPRFQPPVDSPLCLNEKKKIKKYSTDGSVPDIQAGAFLQNVFRTVFIIMHFKKYITS